MEPEDDITLQVAQEEAVAEALSYEFASEMDVREAQDIIIEHAGDESFDPFW